MNIGQESFKDLARRIEDTYPEIDSDICTDLRKTDGRYIGIWREYMELQRDFYVITKVMEDAGEVSLSAEEHKALLRYLDLKNDMENMERQQIYFRGHTDGVAYLKKIGAI